MTWRVMEVQLATCSLCSPQSVALRVSTGGVRGVNCCFVLLNIINIFYGLVVNVKRGLSVRELLMRVAGRTSVTTNCWQSHLSTRTQKAPADLYSLSAKLIQFREAIDGERWGNNQGEEKGRGWRERSKYRYLVAKILHQDFLIYKLAAFYLYFPSFTCSRLSRAAETVSNCIREVKDTAVVSWSIVSFDAHHPSLRLAPDHVGHTVAWMCQSAGGIWLNCCFSGELDIVSDWTRSKWAPKYEWWGIEKGGVNIQWHP